MTAAAEKTSRKPLPAMGETLLEVNKLQKFFPIRGGLLSRVVANVQAVDRAASS